MTLRDHLPILDRPGARRVNEAVYEEREITAPVDLCDARDRLDPEAVCFARKPLFRANLSGHWPRKKRWNFWNWIGPDFVFSVTLADINLASFCAFTLTDFRDGTQWARASNPALGDDCVQNPAWTRRATASASGPRRWNRRRAAAIGRDDGAALTPRQHMCGGTDEQTQSRTCRGERIGGLRSRGAVSIALPHRTRSLPLQTRSLRRS
jgi:hypothetical protein